ncbi:MAG: hypothetical protein IKA64_04335 [Clostridia bacterium]|nr:hypothetical protein [Clostridia bacterium]
MSAKKHFEKHYSRLWRNAVILSALCGAVPGLACAFICALVTWLIGFDGFWLSVALLAAVTVVSAVYLYFRKFRPTALSGARSVDRLGLEERLVTMVEYENEDTVIARLQREDARRELERVNAKSLKVRLSRTVTVLLAVFGVLAVAMLTVSLLSLLGILPSGRDLITDAAGKEDEIRYIVTYDAEEGGYIEGVSEQLVLSGQSTSSVVAVAEDGYIFVEWDDGLTEPGRLDKNITADVVYIAIFEPIDEEDEDEIENEDDEGQPKPDPDADKEGKEPSQPSDKPAAGGGKYEEANQIIDGATYYREVLEAYQKMLLERLEQDADNLTEEERAIIEAYLGIV